MSTTSRVVRTERLEPGVLLVTMDRPEARNAVNDAVAQQMGEAFEALDADGDLRVAVLTGAGGFSAGLDLRAFLEGELGEHPERGFAGLTRVPPRKPVIAAIEGYALAGGLEIALACDLIVAARDARIGIPEVRRGLAADGGALLRLPRLLPGNLAMEMALTGAEVPVDRLHTVGLVNAVTEPRGAVAAALDMARTIAANGPLGVVGSKAVISQSRDWSREEEWTRQQQILAPVWTSADAKEGARAFTEKRDPVFVGE